jgi:glucokinase
LAKAALLGDEIALGIWDQVAAKLASAIMNCCWLLNPQAVIIGGGVAKAGDILFSPLTAHLYAQLSAPFKEHLMILPARFGNDAGMIGAAALALEESGVVLQP